MTRASHRSAIHVDSEDDTLRLYGVGLRAGKTLAFTGEFFDAERAADLELVNEAVPPTNSTNGSQRPSTSFGIGPSRPSA